MRRSTVIYAAKITNCTLQREGRRRTAARSRARANTFICGDIVWTLLCVFSFSGSSSFSANLQSLPHEIKLAGLDRKVEILIDAWGVSHIFADTRHDAFFAQGWNAARDRLWQMDLWRRSGLGELSAALGKAYLDQDRAIRLFTYRGDMNREWAAYGVDAKRDSEAFVDGINAYISSVRNHTVRLPTEFRLAGYEPEFWKVDDIVRVRDHGLAVGVSEEVERAGLLCKTDLHRADLILHVSPPWKPVIPNGLDLCSIPAGVLDQIRLAEKPVEFRQDRHSGEDNRPLGGANQGSNNWVISASRTSTGRPILANDPHRSYEVPSLRYIVHLVAPGLNVIGAGEPALPGIAIGHNEHVAFGITVFPIAQEDLYVYETKPTNPNEYRYGNGWETMQVIHEAIAVRGGADETVQLKFTRHGPVVMEDAAHHRAYAVRATWLDVGGAPYFGALRYLQSSNIEQFREALRHWGEPGENQVYADTSGHIAWFPVGFTPIRSNTDGLLPIPGDGRYEWGGYLDREDLPSAVDPPGGFIATANELNLPANYPYQQRRVSFYWFDGTREKRIKEVLSGLAKGSIRDSEALQNDDLSISGRRLIRVLSEISVSDRTLQELIRWMKHWDFRVTTSSPQAALYEVWVSRFLGPEVIARTIPAVPSSIRSSVSGGTEEIVDLMVHPDARLGLDSRSVRDSIMRDTLAEALGETTKLLGPNRDDWQWGRLANILFESPVSSLASVSDRAKLNVGPEPKSGDGYVVGAAGYRNRDFRVTAGASFRMILDVGAWDNSVAVNAPGQSGDSESSHYRDLVPLWIVGKYFPLLYSRSRIEKATETELVLRPN
jgi:penicillin G amidase